MREIGVVAMLAVIALGVAGFVVVWLVGLGRAIVAAVRGETPRPRSGEWTQGGEAVKEGSAGMEFNGSADG